MLVKTTRTGAGDGAALITAAASERLRIGSYIFLQLLEAGPITILLKFDAVAIHSPILLSSVASGVVLKLPEQTSPLGANLYVNLSASDIDVSVTIEVERRARFSAE